MKRDDVPVLDLEPDDVRGATVSSDEATLGADSIQSSTREMTMDLLYFHLDCARRARLQMDAMTSWRHEYALLYREREQALGMARRHYNFLLINECQITALLASMIEAEGGLI